MSCLSRQTGPAAHKGGDMFTPPLIFAVTLSLDKSVSGKNFYIQTVGKAAFYNVAKIVVTAGYEAGDRPVNELTIHQRAVCGQSDDDISIKMAGCVIKRLQNIIFTAPKYRQAQFSRLVT